MHGVVKWFNAAKGYGFITLDSGEDVMVHHSVISMEGYRDLQEAQEVEFEYTRCERGLRATIVTPLGPCPTGRPGGERSA